MPVFDNVDKVIVVPGDGGGGGGGCLSVIVGIVGFVFFMALITGGLKTSSPQLQPTQSPTVQRRPDAPPTRTPQPVQVTRFQPLEPDQYSRPVPTPVRTHYWPDFEVWQWAGRSWRLPHPPEVKYRYLCNVNGLRWCWHNPPNPVARPCTNNGVNGWCWQETEYR